MLPGDDQRLVRAARGGDEDPFRRPVAPESFAGFGLPNVLDR